MIDHLGITVRDLAASRSFYLAALEPLGIGIVMQVPVDPPVLGFGLAGSTPISLQSGKPSFWIAQGAPSAPVDVAFASASRSAVNSFHAAALAAGGRDNGAPGLRPDYHPNYYAAFVLDPDGNNIEAVRHKPA